MNVSSLSSGSKAFGRPIRVDFPAARMTAGITGLPHYQIQIESSSMTDVGIHIRCMRCGTQMDLRDPGPDMPWTPDQFWVCPKCGRHFWTTYPPPNPDKTKAAKPPETPPST